MCACVCVLKNGNEYKGSYRPWLKAEADEEEDLRHQDGEGQVGMDVVTLVTDGAHRPAAESSPETYSRLTQTFTLCFACICLECPCRCIHKDLDINSDRETKP